MQGLLNIKTRLFPEYPFDLPSRLGKVGTHCLRGVQHLTLTLSTEIMLAPLPAPRLQELQLFILCQLESGREALFVIVTKFSRRKMIAVSCLGSPPALLCGGRTINKSIIHQQPFLPATHYRGRVPGIKVTMHIKTSQAIFCFVAPRQSAAGFCLESHCSVLQLVCCRCLFLMVRQ